jgi:hypothetical protein
MHFTLSRYSDIIATQAKALLHSNTIGLNNTQRSAFRTLYKHATHLEQTIASLATLPGDTIPHYITKQLVNIVAPVQSYAELLNSDWMGSLNTNQIMHVEIILNSAIDLKDMLSGNISTADV